MTRINLVDPEELCDQHLLAEWRELTRIPNSIVSGRLKLKDVPDKYTIRTYDNPLGGQGHVKFFINKLYFLFNRYNKLLLELIKRDMPQKNYWPKDIKFDIILWKDYIPTNEALNLNRIRIKERMPKIPRFYKREVTDDCLKVCR